MQCLSGFELYSRRVPLHTKLHSTQFCPVDAVFLKYFMIILQEQKLKILFLKCLMTCARSYKIVT